MALLVFCHRMCRDARPFVRSHHDSTISGSTFVRQVTYRPDIDGLRAVAVLAVVSFHAFPEIVKGGFIGVDIFFVISGYLISSIIFKELARDRFDFVDFYVRRIRRIFPALLVVLACCLAFGWFVLLPEEMAQLAMHAAAGAAFVSNLALMSEAGYFDTAAATKPLLHLWSLGVEEQFYIVFPLMAWAVWKVRLQVPHVLLAAVVLSFILNIYFLWREPAVAFYLPLARFWELLLGSLLAWLMLYRAPQLGDIWADVLSVAGVILLLAGVALIREGPSFPGYWALLPTVGAVALIWAGPTAAINKYVLASPVAVWFGLVSYSLYLWHWPLLSFGQILYNGSPPLVVRFSLVMAAIALAWLSLRYVETPFRLNRAGDARAVIVLCAGMLCVGVAGVIIMRADLSASHGADRLAIQRRGHEHAVGHSLAWYRGRGDWLYLGNKYSNTVAKLKLAVIPDRQQISAMRAQFERIVTAAARYGTEVILFVAPDKSDVYPEYLPESIKPSSVRYISYFLDNLASVPRLRIYEPIYILRDAKNGGGLLYGMTDTHWNARGAFVAFEGFARLVGVPSPSVRFEKGTPQAGDLIDIAKLKNFPLHAEEKWEPRWAKPPSWAEETVAGVRNDAFGQPSVVKNPGALSEKIVWVVGDSFTTALRPYLNATFKEVRYTGHWVDHLHTLADALALAEQKPDMVVIVRVARSF